MSLICAVLYFIPQTLHFDLIEHLSWDENKSSPSIRNLINFKFLNISLDLNLKRYMLCCVSCSYSVLFMCLLRSGKSPVTLAGLKAVVSEISVALVMVYLTEQRRHGQRDMIESVKNFILVAFQNLFAGSLLVFSDPMCEF